MNINRVNALIAKGGAISPQRGLRTQKPTSGPDSQRLGHAAQHLVAFDILMRGYNCSISAEHLPYDLIAEIGGKLRRVQVKSRAFAVYRVRSHVPVYQFQQLIAENADLFALVAMPEKIVLYRTASLLRSNFDYIQASDFTPAQSTTSWREAMEKTASFRVARTNARAARLAVGAAINAPG